MDYLPLPLVQLLLGMLLAALAAGGAYLLGWLDLSGAFAAFGVGVIVFGLGGLAWSLVLLTFFASSSLLSKLFKDHKEETEKYSAKGARRDAAQVLANGGLASLFVLLSLFTRSDGLAWCGFAAALAAANADTWATEIGALSRVAPALITTGQPVAKGVSGGISRLGTWGSVAGAVLVALVAWLAWPWVGNERSLWAALAIAFAGVVGSLVDSFLGATLQGVYYCPQCAIETEKFPWHTCGTETVHRRGWRWLNNDWVNLGCTLAAALLAIILVGGGSLLG
jgi:uncharacterized protein (TIGR00297 family)